MGYRNIMIESGANLSMKNRQLIITVDEPVSIPIEDINAILIESRQSSVSTALLSFLGQHGVSLFVCDEQHMPCAVLLPYMQHSRQLKMVSAQMDCTLPAKKELWRQIIVAKISNQAIALQLAGKQQATDKLLHLAKTVRSGDTGNVEATAAMLYFPALFGSEFRRGDDSDLRNSCLNYGYAIMRGQIARLLAVYGFLPCFGLNHHSELNSFNLTDDFIEAFRPLVDLFVVSNIAEQEGQLVPELKRKLFELLSYDMKVDGNMHSMHYAAELLVQSFSSILLKSTKKLKLPVLGELHLHRYE